MRHFNAVSLLIASSLLASQTVADPLDEAIALFKRQTVSLSTGGSVTSDTDTSTDDTTSDNTPTTQVSPTTTDDTTVTTPTGAGSTTVELTTTTNTPTQETSSEESSRSAEQTSQATETSRTRVQSSITSQVLVSYTTVTDGSTRVGTSTSETVIPTETEVDPASLSGGSSGGGSSGLSETAKKTIGGVVGGVGGALLLAGLGYTAWRIWGKKKNLHDEDEFDPNMGQDKLSSSTADNSSASPFNRTLESYHSPGPVNQASNF